MQINHHIEFSDEDLCVPSEWDQAKFGIGIKQIDDQHKVLFEHLTQLAKLFEFAVTRSRALEAQSGNAGGGSGGGVGIGRRHAVGSSTRRQLETAFQRGSQISGVIDDLVSYAAKYLAAEDHLLETYGYSERAGHLAEHEAFTRELCRLHKLIDDADAELDDVRRLLTFFKVWKEDHITKSDRAYAPFLSDKGVSS